MSDSISLSTKKNLLSKQSTSSLCMVCLACLLPSYTSSLSSRSSFRDSDCFLFFSGFFYTAPEVFELFCYAIRLSGCISLSSPVTLCQYSSIRMRFYCPCRAKSTLCNCCRLSMLGCIEPPKRGSVFILKR